MLLAMLTECRRRRRNRMAGMGWHHGSPVWAYHDWAMAWERELETEFYKEDIDYRRGNAAQPEEQVNG